MKAVEKGKKPTSKHVPKELYLERPKVVEMALKEEAKFVKLLKDH